MSGGIEVGPRSPIEVARCKAFSDQMCDLAAALNLSQPCFADVICASLASLADLNGADPAARLQALDAYHAVARKHLINLMTHGQVPQ